jgi:hypothetical protein
MEFPIFHNTITKDQRQVQTEQLYVAILETEYRMGNWLAPDQCDVVKKHVTKWYVQHTYLTYIFRVLVVIVSQLILF